MPTSEINYYSERNTIKHTLKLLSLKINIMSGGVFKLSTDRLELLNYPKK